MTPELLRADGRPARIALVHEWFDHFYGSERVAAEILACFPGADVFTLVDIMQGEDRRFLDGKTVTTSFIQRLPFGKSPRFRHYLPLFPLAIEQFDLSGYDLVLSSSHAVAKGVLTGPDQLHIAYVHTPMRYAWELQHDYLRQSGLDRGLKGALARYLMHRLRLWDLRTVNGVDRFIANSAYVGRRIQKTYRRDSTVIHPPVDVERFELEPEKEDHYLAVSRFVPYKHTETIVDAFASLPDKKLVVIGDGPGLKAAKARATANVTLLPPQPFDALERHMRKAKAFIFAPEEDFGITPVEAQAAGTPVIAFGAGGVLETVRDLETMAEPTGLFFDAQTPEAIRQAILRFERHAGSFDAETCRNNALRFAAKHFKAGYTGFVTDAWKDRGGRLAGEDQSESRSKVA